MAKLSRVILLSVLFLGGCEVFESDSRDTRLATLAISSGTLSPAFSTAVLQYTATVEETTTSITVSAAPVHGSASVSINGQSLGAGENNTEIALEVGSNRITIVVTAENGTRRTTYTIVVTRPALTYTIGGSVSGLTGELTLQNNGGDDLVVAADGSFTFATALDDGAAYEVAVSSQPTGQECSVTNGTGTINGANVTDIAVECGAPGIYRVAGSVGGLVGTVTLQLNGSGDYLITRNGPIVFANPLADGAAYEVTILKQPTSQTCTIMNGSGVIAGGHVLNVAVACTGAGSTTGSIFDWKWIDPLPQGNEISGIASDGAQLVAVGGSGTVLTSPDGLNWTQRDSGTDDSLAGIVWADGNFVAVGDRGTVMTSTDGTTWQSQNLGSQTSFFGIVWDGSVLVAYGTIVDPETGISRGAVATSLDGSTWSTQIVGSEDGFFVDSVATNGSIFVATQLITGEVLTSADAVNWTISQPDLSGDVLFDLASDGTRFLATASNGNVYTSLDGTTWTLEAAGVLTLTFRLDWDGSRFVATGLNQIQTSADGTTWATHQVEPSGNVVLRAPITHQALHIVAGDVGRVYTSVNDLAWTLQSSGDFTRLRDIVRVDGQFVAIGDGPTVRTSPDGETWTTTVSTVPASASLSGVTYGDGQYVAVGGTATGALVMTSPDAVTWTTQAEPVPQGLKNVHWGNNQYVAIGDKGTLLTSPDGVDWTVQTSGIDSADRLNHVNWNGAVWVVTGIQFSGNFEAFIATSPDGVTWTKQHRSLYFRPEGLAWNGNQFVGVGNGVIATSPDGLNWSMLQTTARITNVTWSGSQFVAVGSDSYVLTSPDGQNWSVSRSISGWYSSVATDGARVVTVRLFGGILINDSLLGGGP